MRISFNQVSAEHLGGFLRSGVSLHIAAMCYTTPYNTSDNKFKEIVPTYFSIICIAVYFLYSFKAATLICVVITPNEQFYVVYKTQVEC